MRKPIKLILFNVAFVIITLLCFSNKGLGLGFDPGLGVIKFAVSISLAIFGLGMFFVGNYMLLISESKINYKIDKLETIDDCIKALFQCKKTDPSFNKEISKAIEQMQTLKRRKDSLKLLLEHNDASDSFRFLNQTVSKAEFYAVCNVKNIINRLIVFDNKEYLADPDHVDILSHTTYINEKLESTQIILKEYSELLIAFSAIGDTTQIDFEDIRSMTNALNSVLKRAEFKPLEKEYEVTRKQENNQNKED